MTSVISSHNQLHHQLPSFHFPSKSNKEDLSIASDKLKQSGLEINCVDYSPKTQTMFNKLNGMSDKASGLSGSGFRGNIAAVQGLAALQEQNRALAAQQRQRLLQSNVQESAQIKKRLAEINAMELQQQQRGAMAKSLQRSIPGMNASLLKHIPSNTNSSVVPLKKREDEMTKPDLSTLADAAVAAASARNSTGMLAATIKPSDASNQIAALLERRASLPVTKQPAVPSSILKGSMADILRNELNAKHKRTLEEMFQSNATAGLPSGALFQSAASLTALEQLRAHEQLKQRRNSLPARPSSTASELEPLLKKQRMIAQRAAEVESLTSVERRLSFMASQERRASLASSIASVGTSATAPNPTTTSALSPSPASGRMIIDMLGSNPEQRSAVLQKLNKLSPNGFPMPKPTLPTMSVSVPAPAPAQITPEAGKDIIDIITGGSRGSISLREKFNERQAKLGGFPFPLPLHTNSGVNQRGFPQQVTHNNIVSSHIRNNTNAYTVRNAPTLESFKKAYNEIEIMPGGDHEEIRMEMFKRGLQRGDLVIGRKMGYGSSTSFANSFVQQLRRSSLSAHGRGTSSVPVNGRTQQAGSTEGGSIVI